MPAAIEFRDVTVTAPTGQRILGATVNIQQGESVAFIGRSGAGKTTALRLINGLVTPSSGVVVIDGEGLPSIDLTVHRRRTGYIIQGTGLFPHRSVYENIATIPRLLEWSEEKTREAAGRLLETLGMPWDRYAHRKPRTLSGGEQQRAGIARAIIAGPSILLCDEPFGALDPIVRAELQDVFRALRGDSTIVFVTHDLHEAIRVCNRLVLFDQGSIVADVEAERFATVDHPLARSFIAAATLRGIA